jgi:hypothetical protein
MGNFRVCLCGYGYSGIKDVLCRKCGTPLPKPVSEAQRLRTENEIEVKSQIIANYSNGTTHGNLSAQMEAAVSLHMRAEQRAEAAEARADELARRVAELEKVAT